MSQEKAQILATIEGYLAPDDLANVYKNETVVPGICMNEKCNYFIDVSANCHAGLCFECKTKSVRSINILIGD